MIKKLFFAILISSLSATTYAASSTYVNTADGPASSKSQHIGYFGGIITGAAVGGPPGAIAGAILGVLLGDKVDKNQIRIANLETSLSSTQITLIALQAERDSLQRKYQLALEEGRRAETVRVNAIKQQIATRQCCNNTVLSLNFRSGSSKIESHYREQLVSFANLSKQTPETMIEITGYADRNGDFDANNKLSQQRTQAVKQFLTGMGIQARLITTAYHGESKPLHENQSFENDFFDRRVLIRLSNNGNQLVRSSR